MLCLRVLQLSGQIIKQLEGQGTVHEMTEKARNDRVFICHLMSAAKIESKQIQRVA